MRKDRPRCDVPDCTNLAQNTRSKDNPHWRNASWIREEYGTATGYCCQSHHGLRYLIGDWIHKQHRKDYCENIDGRVANTHCTATIIDKRYQLDVDHKNGDSANNEPENLQTLCKNCHGLKTHENRDWETPGRTTIKRLKEIIT